MEGEGNECEGVCEGLVGGRGRDCVREGVIGHIRGCVLIGCVREGVLTGYVNRVC